jgi:hypothetical protein
LLSRVLGRSGSRSNCIAPKNLVGGWLFHLWLFVSYVFQVGGGENEKMFRQSNFDFSATYRLTGRNLMFRLTTTTTTTPTPTTTTNNNNNNSINNINNSINDHYHEQGLEAQRLCEVARRTVLWLRAV